MSERNSGVIADPLFVGATRPPMIWGVTYSAVILNAVCVMQLFLTTKNLLTLLIAVPVHGVCLLLCAQDVRYFDLLLLWIRTRLPSLLTNGRVWKASSHSPLRIDPPNIRGRRRAAIVAAYVARPQTQPEFPAWHRPRFPSSKGEGSFLFTDECSEPVCKR